MRAEAAAKEPSHWGQQQVGGIKGGEGPEAAAPLPLPCLITAPSLSRKEEEVLEQNAALQSGPSNLI